MRMGVLQTASALLPSFVYCGKSSPNIDDGTYSALNYNTERVQLKVDKNLSFGPV
jgi:hypothetical protein